MNDVEFDSFLTECFICFSECKDAASLDTKTVRLGENVTLSCIRDKTWNQKSLFWIRLADGKFPEVLGAAFAFDSDTVVSTPGFTVKQEPGSFVLHITETEMRDSGVYCCLKPDTLNLTVLNATLLRIEGKYRNLNSSSQEPSGFC